MSLNDNVLDELGRVLYESHERGEPIDRITANHDLSIADAYEVQSRVVQHRLDAGATVVGHKVGLTSDGIQDQLDVDQPDFGRLLDTMFVEGRTISVEKLIAPRIETEVGFLIKETLEPPVNYLDVLAATQAVVPVIEVIDSRVRDWDIRIEDTIADNASSARYLTGETRHSIDDVDLSLEGVKLYRNGTLLESGVGAAVLDHPARSVAWLANKLGELDQHLAAGHIVLSGSLTPAIDIEGGDVVAAEFTSIGSVSARVDE